MRTIVVVATLTISSLACAPAPLPPHAVEGTPGGIRYIIGGDSRDDAAHVLPWAFREARARGASGFFFLGDMELTPQLDEHFRNALPLLGPVPFYPVLGNHEVRLFGLFAVAHDHAERSFRRRFLDGRATPLESSLPNKVVYSVSLPGGVHLVALDNVSQRGFGLDQLQWLEKDLEQARQNPDVRFIIVGMHQPLAHNGVTTHSMDADGAIAISDSDAARALMIKHHVSLIVASHMHAFLPFTTDGIPTYITGGLGAPLDPSMHERAFHHFLQVDVGEDALHVTVVRFDGKPSIADGEDRD
jgi:3',5'-cyclic AMP phosphodiesterase CpdA